MQSMGKHVWTCQSQLVFNFWSTCIYFLYLDEKLVQDVETINLLCSIVIEMQKQLFLDTQMKTTLCQGSQTDLTDKCYIANKWSMALITVWFELIFISCLILGFSSVST